MGVQIHTEDPIKPAKASGVTPQTARSNAGDPSQSAQTTATSSPYAYPPAQPGAAAPTPTTTMVQSSSYGSPAPQPGVAPVPAPPTVTPRLGMPPPPKVGEKALSPEHYAPVRPAQAQPQPYPPQMSQQAMDHPLRAVPPGSTTSTSTEPSFRPSAQPSSISPSTDMGPRQSLEHPPGYVQNPFASDMTPDQRFAAGHEEGNRSETRPSLGYIDDPKGPRPGLEDDQTVWGTAKKWVKEMGDKASKLEKEAWDKYGPDE